MSFFERKGAESPPSAPMAVSLWKDGRLGALRPPPLFSLEGMQENPLNTPVVEESSASLEGAEENPPHSFHS